MMSNWSFPNVYWKKKTKFVLRNIYYLKCFYFCTFFVFLFVFFKFYGIVVHILDIIYNIHACKLLISWNLLFIVISHMHYILFRKKMIFLMKRTFYGTHILLNVGFDIWNLRKMPQEMWLTWFMKEPLKNYLEGNIL